ncbi:CRISPR-associated helicase Cas3' [Carbonactinospora thermoautotrophica]|uniref:CRISPR-associated helicase Cas3' n=1 Tax=Carbonactinospora thermoautotrophica TaxID=1469144 RepID=UPI00226F361D|nr:CRISPR-associated helicase Cas3' [Carbonactinospora thermoautotrophica]
MIESGDGARPDVRAAWGKVGKKPVPHPLICHAIDTAAVAERLLGVLVGPRCREELRAAFAPLGDADGWVAVLCGLHDLGKFSPAFQALRDDLAVELLGELAEQDIRYASRFKGGGRTDTPHGLLTAVHLERMLKKWGAASDVAQLVGWALGGHHGHIPNAASVLQAEEAVRHHGGGRWAAWCDALVAEVVRCWGLPAPETLPWGEVRLELGAAVALAGLASVSDWIASDERNFPWAGPDVDLATYPRKARQQAGEAVDRLDWSAWEPPEDTSFTALFPEDSEQRPVQRSVERVARQLQGPGMLLIEAPTGEGKTKAALQCAAILARKLGLAGCYLAMPTKATSNQAYQEACKFADRSPVPLAVRLLHSAADDYLAAKKARRVRDEAEPLDPADVDRDGGPDGAMVAREWFTRKRGLLAPVGVGTVDQILAGAIRSRHVFVRLLGLTNKVVVVDEVHAYDTYMSTLLDRLLWWLGRLGVPVILLSATLPTHRRRDLVRSWRAGALGRLPKDVPEPPEACGYPRVTWADEHGQGVEECGVSSLNAARTVRLEHVPNDQLVAWVLDRVRDGGCAAVIHNLVRRAKETYEGLRAAADKLPKTRRPELVLLHGRLTTKERHEREARLLHALGPESAKNGDRPERLIVVGTQVLEQSLDLDFDLMVSALAPVDSLIQRMGRLHRFGGDRPQPLLAITGVTDQPSGPKFPTHTTRVYEQLLLLRTWARLRGEAQVRSPDDVPDLIDAVYGADGVPCPAGWERAWEEAAKRLASNRDSHEYDARVLYLPQPRGRKVVHKLTERPKSPRRTRKESYRR